VNGESIYARAVRHAIQARPRGTWRQAQRISALVVGALAATVLVGWAHDVRWLTTWGETDWVTQKPATALGLVFSAATATAHAWMKHGKRRDIVMSTGALWLLGLCLLTTWECVPGVTTGLHGLLFHMPGDTDETVKTGTPSLMTLANFWAKATAALALLWYHKHAGTIVRLAAYWLMLTSVVSIVLGYGLNVEFFRYYVPGFSSGMSLPTAVAFALLGFAMLGQEIDEQEQQDDDTPRG